MATITLRFESRLRAPAAQVWDAVSTLAGVNAELMPLMRMSGPQQVRLQDLPRGRTAFVSTLLAAGVLPVDRHALCLERVWPGEGFDERSHSWMQRVWVHRRRLQTLPGGCRISDELEFTPRLAWLGAPLRLIVRSLFTHRHRRLRARFGMLR